MTRDRFLDQLVEWAMTRADVYGAVLIGSQARTDMPADEWSDLDVVLVVEEPAAHLVDEEWLRSFGRPLLTLLEPTPVGQALERRVLYEEGLDVDLTFLTIAALHNAATDPEMAAVIRRGYRVLVDKTAIASAIAEAAASLPAPLRLPNEDELHELAADFWYHAVWTAKKLARGELLMATRAVNGYLKEHFVALVAWHARAGDADIDTWHEARFFESWADTRALDALRASYARYDRGDVAQALLATIDAFELFESETAARIGFADPPTRAPLRALVAAALTPR